MFNVSILHIYLFLVVLLDINILKAWTLHQHALVKYPKESVSYTLNIL